MSARTAPLPTPRAPSVSYVAPPPPRVPDARQSRPELPPAAVSAAPVASAVPAVKAQVVPPARAVAITTAKPGVAPPAAVAPKRRRSFTGEARAAAEKARTEPARSAHRTRRRTFEDEITIRAASPAPDTSAVFDDLDEDTRVLNTKPGGGGPDDVVAQAFERLRAEGSRELELVSSGETPKPPVSLGETPKPPALPVSSPAQPVSSPAQPAQPAPQQSGPKRTIAEAPASKRAAAGESRPRPPPAPPPSQPTSVMSRPVHIQDDATSEGNLSWHEMPDAPHPSPDMDGSGPATERPASIPDMGPAPTPQHAAIPAARPLGKRLETTPALRVAVLATSAAGEVRLIALGANDEAPPGAALAMLVPLTAADGESVARLFGGHE
jgi:hypothetical protein